MNYTDVDWQGPENVFALSVDVLDEGEREGGCASCEEAGAEDPQMQCPKSQRRCGHHCNHVWTHEVCDWCGAEFGAES